MKKVIWVLLAVGILFAFVGCTNNDENNAAVEAKVEEAGAIVQQIYSWYEDNGFLDGEFEAEFKPALDVYVNGIDELKAYHREIIEGGGYDDEETATMLAALDSDITEYNKVLASLEVEVELAEAVEEKFEEAEREAFRAYYGEYLVKMSEDYHSVIVNKYIEAVESGDDTILMETLKEILVLNAHLYEELILFESEYENINYLQSLFIAAVAQRELGYVEVMLALDNLEVTQEEATAAFDVLAESDAIFVEFVTVSEDLKVYYGF